MLTVPAFTHLQRLPDQRRFVQTIAENSNQVIDMASDLLAEASLESDLFNLHLEWTEMRQLVRECVAQLRRVHTAPIRLENHGAPLRIQVDPRLMGQAVTNLVNNAARHAGKNDASFIIKYRNTCCTRSGNSI